MGTAGVSTNLQKCFHGHRARCWLVPWSMWHHVASWGIMRHHEASWGSFTKLTQVSDTIRATHTHQYGLLIECTDCTPTEVLGSAVEHWAPTYRSASPWTQSSLLACLMVHVASWGSFARLTQVSDTISRATFLVLFVVVAKRRSAGRISNILGFHTHASCYSKHLGLSARSGARLELHVLSIHSGDHASRSGVLAKDVTKSHQFGWLSGRSPVWTEHIWHPDWLWLVHWIDKHHLDQE